MGILLELIGLSVLMTWLYIQTGGNVLITILFHAAQSYFVILTDNLTLGQQLWLMSVVYISAGLIVTLLFGPELQRRKLSNSEAPEKI